MDTDGARVILTVGEAAAFLRLGKSSTYRLIGRGAIPAIKVPGTSIVRIRRAALDGLLAKWETGGRRRGRAR